MNVRPDIRMRLRPSQGDLRSDSKTLRYEVETLFGSVVEHSHHDLDEHVVVRNACIESFAIHCRGLIYFFYGHLDEIEGCQRIERLSRLRNNDVIACDFEKSWPQHCPAPTLVLVEAKWQADKHIAHITTERREVNQPGSAVRSTWDLLQVASAICNCLESFLAVTCAENFDADALARIRSAVAKWRSHGSEVGCSWISLVQRRLRNVNTSVINYRR